MQFDESLFERLLRAGVVEEFNGFVQLDIQRRMHSSIAEFPSKHFYGGQVVNGCCDEDRAPIAGFKWPQQGSVRACFVDTSTLYGGSGEEAIGTSVKNSAEADLLVSVLNHLLDAGTVVSTEVAVVTGYAAQRSYLRRRIPDTDVRIDTVDGFQGMERDLVLVSTARSNTAGRVGFLADPRRANVLLTRARRGLIVFGNSSTLWKEQATWQPWLEWVSAKSAYLTKADVAQWLC